MKNIFKKSIPMTSLAILIFLGLLGCKQNPYPKGAVLKQSQVEQGPIDRPIGVEMDGLMECKEGETCEMKIVPHVSRGKTAVIQFVGLPVGATYDLTTNILSYTPDFDVVDLKTLPTKTSVSFAAGFYISEKEVPGQKSYYPFPITVGNVNREIGITTDVADVVVTEAKTAIQTIELTSLDLPQGPFTPMLTDHPDGMMISSLDATKFAIRFTPGRTVVTSRDPMDYTLNKRFREFDFKVSFSLPSGQVVERQLNWKVIDDRLAPAVSSPTELEQGPVVSFTVRAEDLNGESAPILNSNPEVAFGRLNLTKLVSNPANPSALPSVLYSVQWDQLTTADIGKIQDIKFNFCSGYDAEFCTLQTVKVKVTGNQHPKPIMDRASWPVATLQSMRMGEKIVLPLTIRDAEDYRLTPKVEVFPKAMAPFIKLLGGEIEVTAPAEGIHQFSIEVTSFFDQKISEGFLFEVLPSAWESTVILTGYGPSKEATAIQQLLGKGEVLSSVYQLNDSSMRLRSAMIVTTEALLIPESVKLIEKYRSKVRTLIVSSPAIENSSGLKSQLAALGVNFKNRIQDDLTRYTLVVNPKSNLETPSIPGGLQGALTSESLKPQTFEVIRSSDCDSLLYLQKPATQLTVGVDCVSKDQRTVVLGFEIGDMLLSSQDQDIGKKWLTSWIKGARK